jgi:hypothetical protein
VLLRVVSAARCATAYLSKWMKLTWNSTNLNEVSSENAVNMSVSTCQCRVSAVHVPGPQMNPKTVAAEFHAMIFVRDCV